MQQRYLKELEERFLRYVKIDTQSDEACTDAPSTSKQYDLLKILVEELQILGAQDVILIPYACVLATIPATIPSDTVPTVAFLAHVDTAPAFNGTDVVPMVHRNYDGQPIVLPDATDRIINAQNSPALKDKVGEDIVTASGLTLLGADDKAGIAIIMTMARVLLEHPEIPHGDIRLCFTPDEEVGRGVAHLTVEDLAADVAYTLDGGPLGEITYETFSADRAVVTITGVSVHPGTAKGQMVNALALASDLISRLPRDARTPETTEGREGFIHLYQMHGGAAEVELHFILRDFELDGLASHGDLLNVLVAEMQAEEPRAKLTCKITPQYRNMRYWLENNMQPVELAIQAIEACALQPLIKPVRGGTDGSRLTEKGVPTPNLFTGMANYHGPLEWVSLQDMVKATKVCLKLVQIWSEQ